MNKTILVLLSVAGLIATSLSRADFIAWTANLDQAQEVGMPVSVPGAMGSAAGSIDTMSGLLSWNISWSGLSSAPFGMHFHGPGAAGSNAGVSVNFGAISGLASPSIGATTITPMQITELLAGLWYINIHTPLNAPGEIRGQVQITAVPEPGTLALIGLGLAGMGLARRKRRV